MAHEATRRGLLVAAATLPLVASGCKGIGALGTPPRPLPDVAVLREAIAGEDVMISRYTAVLAAAPALAARWIRSFASTASIWPGSGHA